MVLNPHLRVMGPDPPSGKPSSFQGENGRSVEGRQWLQEAAEVKLPRCPSRWDGKLKDYSVELLGGGLTARVPSQGYKFLFV